jgi:putative membrane-bound dehydrogenase-like protein
MKLPRPFLLVLLTAAIASGAEFPQPTNTEKDMSIPLMPAGEAAAKFQVPPGFKVTVFASEPDVQNPIAMSWDGRGRLWVAENYTYAERPTRFELGLRDRVVIFDGTNGGHFTKRTVFTDDVQMLTSIAVGHGGVYMMCPPQLLFVPDRNGDDKPDGPAEVLLDGFTPPQDNYHNFANGLKFGPDGWLYGRCGASAPGEVGAPGTPAAERIPLRGTIWRFHPKTHVFEALGSGTTNPWGHDWNEHGELFFINTVNGHLWHGITGAHYVRPHTIDPNPHVYEMIDQHADHWHFDTAQDWTKSRGGAANALGGGHAHIGMMFYLGDNWPAEYRGHLFTWNMHGRRANQEIIERQGSGYVGRHGTDILLAEDKWFRGLDLDYGPDGGVFAIDWSDTGECHDSTGVHRTSGRIFKITYEESGERKPETGKISPPPAVGGHGKNATPFDLAKMSDAELVKLHTHENEWWSRQARLELAGRAASGKGTENAADLLREMFAKDADTVHKLRALWTLHSAGFADEKLLRRLLADDNEHLRAWAIRLLTDHWPLDTCMSKRPVDEAADKAIPDYGFGDMAQNETSGLVRLALASALQRIPLNERANITLSLASWHKEDANDHNLPLMIWYGLIPVGDSDPERLSVIATTNGCLPLVRHFAARRLAEDIEKNPEPVNRLLDFAEFGETAEQLEILTGLNEGMTGWRKATKPALWDRFVKSLGDIKDDTLRARVRELSVLFGDGRALDEVKKIALDEKADISARKAALQSLIEANPPELRAVCEQLLNTRFLNAVAVRGLSRFDDPALGDKLAKSYRNFHGSERGAVLETLISRAAFAKALLAEVAAGKIPRADVTPFHARQIRAFKDPALDKLLTEAWGELREPAADKQALIAKLKSRLTPGTLAKADLPAGRAVFTTLCATCHRLYGQGGEIGPDLTGAGRDNLDYLLENIADPSAVVNADFRMTIVEMKDGRILAGVVPAQTARTVTIRALTGSTTVERGDIKKMEQSAVSMMPEGLLEAISETQARDLIGYLMQKTQVPLPEEKH